MSGSNATTASALSVSDITTLDGEPRIEDLRIAERLGFDRPRDIRKLVERHSKELESYGGICATVAQNTEPKGRGRPGREYRLNEGQTLLICMLARTPQAAAVRKEVIDVYMAYRQGDAEDPRKLEDHPADPLNGFGYIRMGGELVYFDSRLESINCKDGIVAMMPRPGNDTPKLMVLDGLMVHIPDDGGIFGDRKVVRYAGIDPQHGLPVYEECIALGRVVLRESCK
ncbi:hypothetical protein [Fodinicurvata sp. EGI_FJ10296]|uniref:hypothetical protein n=1 Tax=Fodinicurvata sp. EGI_FJ10296 TaxID=3231908 RepID=UPI003452C905